MLVLVNIFLPSRTGGRTVVVVCKTGLSRADWMDVLPFLGILKLRVKKDYIRSSDLIIRNFRPSFRVGFALDLCFPSI